MLGHFEYVFSWEEEEWKVEERTGGKEIFMFLGNVRVANVTLIIWVLFGLFTSISFHYVRTSLRG